MRMNGKVVVVTGAAGAIGSTTALALAREGAKVVMTDLDPDALGWVAAAIDPAECHLVPVDIGTLEGNRAVAQAALDRYGRIDGLFASAGIEGQPNTIERYAAEAYDRVMNVNVKGLLFGLQAIAPRMADSGSIVLASSIAGLHAAPLNVAYAASKHAVVGVMRTAAAEFAPRRIRVNSVHPGYVDSPMLRRIMSQHPDPQEVEQRFLSRIALGEFVTPRDVALGVMFLLSDEARMMTGHTLVVDGGAYL